MILFVWVEVEAADDVVARVLEVEGDGVGRPPHVPAAHVVVVGGAELLAVLVRVPGLMLSLTQSSAASLKAGTVIVITN